jgi:hypothetical protein
MGWARHLPPSLRLLGAELEERSLLEGSELVVLVFACCFSCSCSCAAIFLLSPPHSKNRSGSPPSSRATPARTPPPPREKSNLCARQKGRETRGEGK